VSLTFGEAQHDGTPGVTLAQLNALTEQATREAISRGIDPEQVVPKIRATFGAKIKSIQIEIG
jgi:hypothetical protein